jgi:tetratricopeptide (TPR) repeat protein
MDCAKCGHKTIPEGVSSCPTCGAAVSRPAKARTKIQSSVKVGSVKGGKVTGVAIGRAQGDVTIKSTVTQIEKTIVKGDYVDRKTIIHNVQALGPTAIDEIAKKLMSHLGISKRILESGGEPSVPRHVSRQIKEITAAQKVAARKGVLLTPPAAYRLGMLAAYDRKYEEALDYFRQATAANADYSDAHEAISWLQQTLAMSDMQSRNYEGAMERLREAREAGFHTDPLDHRALSQRGYVSKTLAQLAEAMQQNEDRDKYYKEAGRLFMHVAELDPKGPSAQNGLGNVQHALGNIDAAIAAYRRAIELLPSYAAAHHDLALAYEDKMKVDAGHAAEWCRQALAEWKKAHALAASDPGFTLRDIAGIEDRIQRIEAECQ